MNFKFINIFLALSLFSTNAFATTWGENPKPTCPPGTTLSTGTNGTQTCIAGVSNNATASKKDSDSTNVAGIIMAALMFAMCPTNPAACALGAMALMDALKAKDNGNNSTNTNNVVGGGAGTGTLADGGTSGTGGLTTQQIADLQAKKLALEAQGYKFDEKTGTVTFPGGNTVRGSSLASQAGIQAAGFSEDQAKKFHEQIQAAMSQASVQVASSDESTGKPGGSTDGGSAEGVSVGTVQVASTHAHNGGADVTGLSKKYGDDLIGVSAADIFIIVNKKYEAETNNGMFH